MGQRNLEQTRALFLDLAQQEFHQYGYANASTTRIVEQSGMARGSLYYHFNDKRDLFLEVYKISMAAMANDLKSTVLKGHHTANHVFIGLAKRYFEICANTDIGKLTMETSLSILSAEERQDITSKTLRPVLTTSVQLIKDSGGLKGQNRDMITMFLFSALTESARIISTLPNKNMAKAKFFETFEWVLTKIT